MFTQPRAFELWAFELVGPALLSGHTWCPDSNDLQLVAFQPTSAGFAVQGKI